jgi:tRNA pseudouridine55 synthase
MNDRPQRPLCGILLVSKPADISSARVVAVVKRMLRGEAKVGHLGTLDPFAQGLLPLVIGEGTKLAPYLNDADKRYTGEVRLGVTSDTLDRTGQIIEEAPIPALDNQRLSAVAQSFVGDAMQIPPAFSAIKRGGVPMYRRARQGVATDLEPRAVQIHSLSLELRDESHLLLEVHCSKGTYVRAIARDIGAKLGTVALLDSLVRTEFGGFSIDSAVDLSALEAAGLCGLEATNAWIPGVKAVSHLRKLEADTGTARALRAGQQRALGVFPRPSAADTHARVVDADGRLVAVLSHGAGAWRIARVFAETGPCAA